MGPGEVYTLFKLGDRDAGTAAYTLRNEQKGMPPNWSIYIAVENADASAKRAAELGGKICMQPFDVFDMGRMAVVQDPTGAAFCLWQAKQKPNAVTGVEGTLCWADLSSPDPKQAEKFYSGLFGWKLETSSTIRLATCSSKMASSSSEACQKPKIAPPAPRTGFHTSRCRTVTPAPRKQSKPAPIFNWSQWKWKA